MTIAGSPL